MAISVIKRLREGVGKMEVTLGYIVRVSKKKRVRREREREGGEKEQTVVLFKNVRK